MGVRVNIVLLALTQCSCTYSKTTTTSVAGSYSEDGIFIHKTFPVPSSTKAIIEVDVSYPLEYISIFLIFPVIGIYTTQDHVNIKKQKRCMDKLEIEICIQ